MGTLYYNWDAISPALFRMDCMRLSFENDLKLTALLFLLFLLLLVELFGREEQVSVVGAGAGDLACPL